MFGFAASFKMKALLANRLYTWIYPKGDEAPPGIEGKKSTGLFAKKSKSKHVSPSELEKTLELKLHPKFVTINRW